MGNIGATEIILILILALIVFGPRRLPEIGRTVGKSLREFRKASQDLRDEFQFSLDDDEPPMVTSATQPQPVAEPEPKARTKPKTKSQTKPPAAATGGKKPVARAKTRTPAGGTTRARSRSPKSGTTGTQTRSA